MAADNSKEKVISDIIRVERDKFYGSPWTGMLPNDFMLVFQKSFYEFDPTSLGRWKDALETKNRKTPVVSDVIIISKRIACAICTNYPH